MSFDTALVKLVGAGLGAIGAGTTGVAVAPVANDAGMGLIDDLARRGEARAVGRLIEAVARDLVAEFHAEPVATTRHAAGLPEIILDHAPDRPEVTSALVMCNAAAEPGPGQRADLAVAARGIASRLIERARDTGALARAELEPARSLRIVEPLMVRVLAERQLLSALGPALRRLRATQSSAHAGAKAAAPASPAKGQTEVATQLERLKPAIEAIGGKAGVPRPVVLLMAMALAECGIADEEVESRLAQKAAAFRELEQRLARVGGPDPAVATLRAQASHAARSGRFEIADRLLDQAQEVDLAAARDQYENTRQRLVSAAESRAERGRLEELRLSYRAAAAHYSEAARCLPGHDETGRWRYLMMQAEALGRQGTELGEAVALEQALSLHEDCLRLRPRETASKDWAITQNLFGRLHARLGEREASGDRLESAAALCKEAAGELWGRREPRRWAAALTDYADILARIGALRGEDNWLDEAITAWRETLAVYSREAAPEDWANAQVSIARALARSGAAAANSSRLEQAVAAFRLAAGVQLAGAGTHSSVMAKLELADALAALANLKRGPRPIAEAESAYRQAIALMDCARAPQPWARAQSGLGLVLLAAGRATRNRERLEAAQQAFRAALEVHAPDRAPAEFARASRGLADVLEELADLDNHPGACLNEAIGAHRAALAVMDRRAAPGAWARAGLDLARCLYRHGLESGSERLLSEAVAAEQAAMEELEHAGESELAAAVRDSLAEKLAALGERDSVASLVG